MRKPIQSASVSPSIVLDSVTHYFGTRCVLKSVSCKVDSGEILIVSGANGSGKSTLLRVIAGLLAPTSGTAVVTVDSLEFSAAAARRHVGYVAPDLVLYAELTGAENLFFFAELHGLSLSRDDVRERLARVGLQGRGRDLAGGYSSGMRQRLKYAFALLHDPPILVLDEPTANLDLDGIAIVEQVVKAQHNRLGGGLAVVATNEPRELEWSGLRLHLEASG